MFENIIYFAYDFNINVNKALVRELEGTACAYRCWKRHDDGLADISRPELHAVFVNFQIIIFMHAQYNTRGMNVYACMYPTSFGTVSRALLSARGACIIHD